MELLKNEKNKLQEASKRIVCALFKSGYISETEKKWFIYRVEMGDREAYRELRELLLEMAAEFNSVIY